MNFGLPEDWLAPRKEFLVQGFRGELHFYAFEVAPLEVSHSDGIKIVCGARCCKCDGVMHPDRETLVDHAKLHLAVKLARDPAHKATA